jgi:hypothetical protein
MQKADLYIGRVIKPISYAGATVLKVGIVN